jgi:hypothetical protein
MNAAAPERSTTPTDKLSGVIERVTFFNEESGFCVLRIKAPGHREEVTVIGSLPSVSAGEWLSGEGWWVRDKEHGLQFKASTIRTVPPTTVEGIERSNSMVYSFVLPDSACLYASSLCSRSLMSFPSPQLRRSLQDS